ncbi:short transient receptor potential channel 3, partial [Biomphalaria glabrata]
CGETISRSQECISYQLVIMHHVPSDMYKKGSLRRKRKDQDDLQDTKEVIYQLYSMYGRLAARLEL